MDSGTACKLDNTWLNSWELLVLNKLCTRHMLQILSQICTIALHTGILYQCMLIFAMTKLGYKHFSCIF